MDAVVIGAGIVGLAVARALAEQGRDVLVLEKENAFGLHTSSRNSEVIHAGIYYPPGSLKAQLCVSGKQMIYDYCRDRGLGHQRCGKLIVAVDVAEEEGLRQLQERAVANGVHDLVWLDGAQVRDLEPDIVCRSALLSPSSGIVDSHALMLALLGDAQSQGAMLALGSDVVGGRCEDRRIVLQVRDTSGEEIELACAAVVNSAGHGAHGVAASLVGYPVEALPMRKLAKGNYFTVNGKTRFRHLIYPMPVDGGLGIHVTLDLGGGVRLGPDLHWVDHLDYTVDPSLAPIFCEAVARYWPGISELSLSPGYAGIRPKIVGAGGGASDFMVQTCSGHGIQSLVNLFGIESPGLTSCMAIAQLVAATLSE